MAQSETKELTITRIIDAPLQLVWQAWTDVAQIAQWWGPKGFTNPVCEWDAKVGSKILIHMKAPDGQLYPMDGLFQEIIKNEKLVFTSAALDQNGKHLFEILNTITFHKEADKTKLILHFIVSNITPEGATHIGGMEMGWNLSLDRLAALTDSTPFMIERIFDAPVDLLWQALTDRDTMKQWYFDLEKFIPEVGFEFSFTGGKSGGTQYVHLCQVKEVITGRKISYSWRYEGYEGDSLVSFELFPEDDKTRLKLTHSGLHSFPLSNPDLAKHNFARGWNHIIHTSLANFFSKTK